MRLYLLECGTLRTQRHLIEHGCGHGEPFEIPVPFFLVTHPRGNVLFDGGNALEVARDARRHWGSVLDTHVPVMEEQQWVGNQLRRLGVDSGSIRLVVQSHLHCDHTGALGHFPHAEVVVRRRELEYARAPHWFQRASYIRADLERPGIRWRALEDADEHDLYGDGTLRLVPTPGHSPGHQSLLVTLPRSGPLLLTADAAYTRAVYEERCLGGLLASAMEGSDSLARLRALQAETGAAVVTGHDPGEWPGFRRAPAFYD